MLQIPEYWRSPQYEELSPGFKDTGAICMSVKDSQRIIHNQKMCDTYLKDAVDLLDAISK